MLSPYLRPNRLSELIAALQVMGLHEKYRETPSSWSYLISGKQDSEKWKRIFEEHPEFFRVSPTFHDEYGLIIRRAVSPLYDRRKHKCISGEERDEMTQPDRDKYLTRAPLTESQLKLLMDTATGLHQSFVEAHDYRWLVGPVLSLIAACAGAFIGAFFRHSLS